MATESKSLPQQILFFDGLCHFCDRSVVLVQRYNKKKRIHFAPLQGETAQLLLPNLDPSNLKSLVYYRNGKVFTRSRGVLEVARDMEGLWPLCYFFIIVPYFIRNWAYDFIAKNRYRWFGMKEACTLPTAGERQSYLP